MRRGGEKKGRGEITIKREKGERKGKESAAGQDLNARGKKDR